MTDPTPWLVVAGLLAAVALHVWYAVMLARVLERLGADGWRAWVPLLNQAEVLRLGGVPPVAAVLLIVPVVQLVGLALVGLAASRLNAHFGRGTGTTVLAVLAPPVWATLLARAATDAGAVSRITQAAAWAAPRPDAPAPADAPATPPTSAIEPPARILPPAGGVPFVPATPAERIVPPPGLFDSPPADDPVEHTVVVDRRPPVSWSLDVEGGSRLPLAGDRVVLGRRPLGAGDGAVELELPDPTRTLSKVHARLELADGRWTITDRHATNGVIVVDEHGAERLLDPGETAPVVGRVLLGRVAVRILADEGAE